jgi:uncharacterized caspase-like protein
MSATRYRLWLTLLLVLTLAFHTLAHAQKKRGVALEPAVQGVPNPLGGGAYRALIIGNQDYADPSGHWKSLQTPLQDARAMQRVLRDLYGFQDVQLLANATRRDMLLALHDLGKRVQGDDNVLIYYAGHGFLEPDTERGYWVPVDAQGTDHTTFLRNSTIRDELSIVSGRARHTLLISDSCFSGTLLRGGSRGMPQDTGSERYYRQVAGKKSVQILSAGGIEYVDDDYAASGHSPFTYFLLNTLSNNQQDILVTSELADDVTSAVTNNVDQVPQSGVLQGAGDELGEFIFLKLDVQVEGVDPERVKVQVNVVPKPAATESGSPESAGEPQSGDTPLRVIAPMPTL